MNVRNFVLLESSEKLSYEFNIKCYKEFFKKRNSLKGSSDRSIQFTYFQEEEEEE